MSSNIWSWRGLFTHFTSLGPHNLAKLEWGKPRGTHSLVKWSKIPVNCIKFLPTITIFGFQGYKIKNLSLICRRNVYLSDFMGLAIQSCKIQCRNKYMRIQQRQNQIIMGIFITSQGSYPTDELNIRPIWTFLKTVYYSYVKLLFYKSCTVKHTDCMQKVCLVHLFKPTSVDYGLECGWIKGVGLILSCECTQDRIKIR